MSQVRQAKFNLLFDASMDISKIRGSLNAIKGALNGIKLPPNLANNLEKTFNNLTNEVNKFEAQTSTAFTSMTDVNKTSSSMQKIIEYYNQLQIYLRDIGDMADIDPSQFFPEEVINNIKKARDALDEYGKEIDDINKEKSEIERVEKNLNKARNDFRENKSKKDIAEAALKEYGGYDEAVKKLDGLREQLVKARSNKTLLKKQADRTTLSDKERDEVLKKLTDEEKNVENLGEAYDNLKEKIDNVKNANKAITESQNEINKYETELKELNDAFELANTEKSTQALNNLRQKLADIMKVNIDEIPEDLNEINKIISNISATPLENIKNGIKKMDNAADEAKQGVGHLEEEFKGFSNTARDMASTANEVERLKGQVLDFFSVTNAIQLFKRTIRSAFETVKELDKAMTETAVVTDFSVGDMWDRLPEYTKAANELGATTQGAYETMTLYYQQGLNTEETFAIGTETMKMARIAGLDYAQTTDLMTAALRGFNMELNTTSAQRINDVYSELAAISASDTREIATAMTKTASIAANANMEFETTAAFLAQMIETTRESPENLGTAMKTIIARFTEMKEAPSDVFEVDGETVDVNKIDTALKSVGVSLKDTKGQFRDLDDVFIELASKWDSLDVMQQRYIATTAAGSRLSVNRLLLAA